MKCISAAIVLFTGSILYLGTFASSEIISGPKEELLLVSCLLMIPGGVAWLWFLWNEGKQKL